MNSGRDTPLCTAKVKSGEVTLLEPVYDEILAQLKVRNIDVLIVDPFVSSHAVTENDNMAIDAVVKAWARVAELLTVQSCLFIIPAKKTALRLRLIVLAVAALSSGLCGIAGL